MNKKRLLSLDLVRSVAIFLIILFHYNHWIGFFISKNLTVLDYKDFTSVIGVTMFLVLSGASLTVSSKDKFNVVAFYIRRFWAIFPLFYVCYAFILLTTTVLFKFPFIRFQPLSILPTLIGMDGYLSYRINTYYLIGEWFLGLIIIYYLLFPVIRYCYLKNKHLTVLLAAVISFASYQYYSFAMHFSRFPTVRLLELAGTRYTRHKV